VERTLEPPHEDWRSRSVERQWEHVDGGNSGDAQHRSAYRTPQQRDRDRVLYCSALQRLAYVTQVTAPESGHTFHNRLSHSLKVAQVGRRNTERLYKLVEEKHITGAAARLVLSVNPDAVEASCLAHDIGHPPFGHIAEEELHAQATDHVHDGFEGNAQSFRIVTRLAVRDANQGLNLTRETLESLLKYPWQHHTKDAVSGKKREKKWGYYKDDKDAFTFTRKYWPTEVKTTIPEKSLGAEIMDWADDLTYAVHDVDDFFRAGLVPLDRLRGQYDAELKYLTRRLTEIKYEDPDVFPKYEIDELVEAARQIISLFGPGEPYSHTTAARAGLREFGAKLITRYLEAFTLGEATG
jgi:dGTPase